MRVDNPQAEASIAALESYIGKLKGGSSAEIGAFSSWFMNSEWEARMASDSAAVRLGWSIQGVLYQWEAYPDLVPIDWVVDRLQAAIELYRRSTYEVPGNDRESAEPSEMVRSNSNATAKSLRFEISPELADSHKGVVAIAKGSSQIHQLSPVGGSARTSNGYAPTSRS